jgi:hypothetical protein
MEMIHSSGTSVPTGGTRRHIPEDGILQSPLRKPQILHSINGLGSVADTVFPERYELGVYIPEDGVLHSPRRENLKSYIALTGWAL